MSDPQLSLFDAVGALPRDAARRAPTDAQMTPDDAARAFAVDPRNNVVLEASAGTGKTSVLVSRYVNLVKQGVEPANILAITFTRKAAAEMRERIVAQLRDAAAKSEIDRARWTELRDRLGEIAISTIDAFCLSLLREFPLEADLDPGFEMADETEVPRILSESLDRSLRILVRLAADDADVALVLAQLGMGRTREGLASLLERRLVASGALDRFLARGPYDLTPRLVCDRAADALHDALRGLAGGLPQFLADGPTRHGRYRLFTREVARLVDWHNSRAKGASHLSAKGASHLPPQGPGASPLFAKSASPLSGESASHLSGEGASHRTDAAVRGSLERIGSHFLTNDGEARRSGRIPPYVAADYPTRDAEKRHRDALFAVAPQIERVVSAFHRDLNVVLARGVRRMFAVALQQYRAALDERSVLDFSDVLYRALELLRNMGEFSQSRYRLESRYHHVLVDEFQDTSRAQWELVSLLIQAWGEGLGLPSQPSIFIVGDRKQSIYRFRDAEVSVLREAARHIDALRIGGANGSGRTSSRRSISRSFRAVPALQAFVNDVFTEIAQRPDPADAEAPVQPDDFTFEASDRFPSEAAPPPADAVLGLAVGDSPDACAAAVADEVRRVLADAMVRDRETGVARRATPGDIAILFRSRTTHREFERELIARGIPTYVYKGLGFFDADEIKDLTALLRYLADPGSDLRTAALLRSRFVRLSDKGLAALAPHLAAAVTQPLAPSVWASLEDADRRVLEHTRAFVPGWLARVDRMPPSDLLEHILADAAYAYEIRGPRRLQAWENIKKMRGLVRRMQNRGYATVRRLAEHLDALGSGDESNAVLEAVDAVNLMTVHASKGLEFPVVFVVNLARGATAPPRPVRVVVHGDAESVTVGPFASEMDEAERERDKHEARRLLYVALTRARDRLYLSTSLKEGELAPGRGSLAEVLPASLRELFERARSALAGVPALAWQGASGATYEWRLCPAGSSPDEPPALSTPTSGAERRGVLDVFRERPVQAGARRTGVTNWLEPDRTPSRPDGPSSDALIGTLVHRLLQLAPHVGHDVDWPAFARGLLRPEERASVSDMNTIATAALTAWESIRNQPEIARTLTSGTLLHEVPFSLVDSRDPFVVLRGTIDCLVRRPDGSVVVLEFKTGRGSPSHERQLDVYVRAARACYPDAEVEGRLVYL